MKSLMLIAVMMFVSTTVYAEGTNPKFDAYQQRLAQRRAVALELRREYNAAKGPHVYRTAIAYNFPRYVGIEGGWVNQPPIPVRPIVVVPHSTVVYRNNRTIQYSGQHSAQPVRHAALPVRNVFVRN